VILYLSPIRGLRDLPTEPATDKENPDA